MSPRRGALALLGALLFVASCGSSATSPQKATATWSSQTGLGHAIAQIRSDLATATTAVDEGRSSSTLHTVCGALLLDVQGANDSLPSPDPTLSRLLADAYTHAGAAAHECYDAQGDPAKVAQFARDRAEALSLLAQASARAEAVIGRPLGTTPSTTTPGSL